MSDQSKGTQGIPGAATPQQQQLLLNAIHGQVPGLYANGFGMVASASDVSVVLLLNNNPVAVLSLSHISAKSLRDDLSKTLDQFEKAIKQPIKTINEIAEDLKKAMGAANVRQL